MTGSPATARRSDTIARVGTAVALASAYRMRRPTRLRSGHRAAMAATVALAGPALVVARAASGRTVTWRAPGSAAGSAAGSAVLVARLGAGAVVEEVLWRAPIVRCRGARGRVLRAALLGAGFVVLHLHRDGASSWRAHVPNTVAWTLAATLDRRLRWSILSHAAYNLVALCLHAADTREVTP